MSDQHRSGTEAPDAGHTPGPMERARRRQPLRLPFDASAVLGYTVSCVMAVVGGAVAFGMFVHDGVPPQFRITLGVVMVLMGLYRFVITRMRSAERERARRDEEEDEA